MATVLFALSLSLPFVALALAGLWLRPAGLRSFGGRA
jgi:hypothetical protein